MTAGGWPRRVAIVGLGLIGGSLGLALQQYRPEIHVVGVDRDHAVLERARERGAVDTIQGSLCEGVADADLVVLATPVSGILAHVAELSEFARDDALVTDVGSTKRTICQKGREALGERFIGGHPLAGSERTGIDAARGDLFQSRNWVLTPANDDEANVDDPPPPRLSALIDSLGASVAPMTPDRHDRVVAATSHLPQLLSVALGARLADGAERDDAYRALIASGSADWLRLARSSPEIWRDIAATNADRIRAEIQTLVRELQALDGDLDRLDDAFHQANRLAPRPAAGVSWRQPKEVIERDRRQQGTVD